MSIKEHPDWALKHKTPGTEIKCIKNKYYLYRITSKWSSEKKRAKKVSLGIIGAIHKDGIKYSNERKKQDLYVLEFGGSELLHNIAKEENIIKHLREVFPEEWELIIVIAIIRVLYQNPLKNCQLYFDDSYLKTYYPALSLDKNIITQLFQAIGNNRDKMLSFMKKFIVGSEHIVFDATNIISHSDKLGINQRGYNSNMIFDRQVNLLYAFSTTQKAPCYYRIIPGNIREITAFKMSLEEAELRKAVIIADKGFASEDNLTMIEQEKLNYIVPLRRDNKLINYSIFESNDKKLDGYLMFNGRVIWYISYENNDKKLIMFLDSKLAESEQRDYMLRIDKKYEGYSIEDFYEKQYRFGVITIVTNLDVEIKSYTTDVGHEACNNKEEFAFNNKISPIVIYQYLKTRGLIEDMFDVFKNILEADRTYMRNEQSLETWMFINHIAMMIYYKIQSKLIAHNLLNQHSPSDLLAMLKQVRKVKIKEQWRTAEVTKKTKKLLKQLGLPIT